MTTVETPMPVGLLVAAMVEAQEMTVTDGVAPSPLLFGFEGEECRVAAPVPPSVDVFALLRRKPAGIDGLVLVLDAYGQEVETHDELLLFEESKGDMPLRWARGDKEVVECLVGICAVRDEVPAVGIVGYRKDDEGVMEFSEPLIMPPGNMDRTTTKYVLALMDAVEEL